VFVEVNNCWLGSLCASRPNHLNGIGSYFIVVIGSYFIVVVHVQLKRLRQATLEFKSEHTHQLMGFAFSTMNSPRYMVEGMLSCNSIDLLVCRVVVPSSPLEHCQDVTIELGGNLTQPRGNLPQPEHSGFF